MTPPERLGSPTAAATIPPADCQLCPRLAAFRAEARAREPNWFNAPVPTFADDAADLIVVGLAPGLKGANRTGRPFTGDFAGDLLYPTLLKRGFAAGSYDRRPDDGLRLRGCAITNAVRCVPPKNKPLPAEVATCRRFLAPLFAAAAPPRAVVALGRIAHETLLRTFGVRLAAAPFRHGSRHDLVSAAGRPVALFDSFHCSRYNTNTGLLTPAMFDQVFADARAFLES